MREIKFRAPCITDGTIKGHYEYFTFYDIDHANGDDKEIALNSGFMVRPDSLEQFTGLHDKNGKEIYEGDIVQNAYNEVASTVWDADTASFIFLTKNAGIKNWINMKTSLDRLTEVIGNIYENAELLTNK